MNDRTTLIKDLRDGNGKTPEVKGAVNGKAFVAELDKCQTPEDIYTLLLKSMDLDTLKDRVKFLRSDLVVALESSKARCNAELGFRTSHEAMVNMAAGKFQKITEGNTGKKVEDFRKGLAEYTLNQSMKREIDPLVAVRMSGGRGS